jgi:hypothetical protein
MSLTDRDFYLTALVKLGGAWLVNPYHNLSHALRVADTVSRTLKEDPTFIVAALFHDWGHPGTMGDDGKNIERTCAKVMSLPKREGVDLERAAELIRGTQFPLPDGMVLTPEQGILRDADFWHTAFLNDQDWLQVQAGLATEFGKSLKDWLIGNVSYIETVPTFSKWGAMTAEDYRGFLVRQARRWADRL